MKKKVWFIFLFSIVSSCLFSQQNETHKQTPELQIDQQQEAPFFPEELKADRTKQEQDSNKFMRDFLYMIFLLGALIAVLLILTWVSKRLLATRMQQMNLTSMIKILERRPLSPRSTVYLLDIQGTGILIAESHTGVSKLATISLESVGEAETEV